MLNENRGISMVLEFWPYGLSRAGTSAKELLRLLERQGFRYRLIGDARPESVGPGAGDYANLIAEREGSSSSEGFG